MATATKQLEAIHQELSERFSGDPVITVTPLDGDPPEKYEITYNTTGLYKDDSGTIQERGSHTITISIPFGFPHFPPSCKPKSSIFHPDFDPAAICIGDFWEKDRSISELISHLGQMISGKVFSTSNAFNEEAAKWYQDNHSKLPLEQIQPAQSAVEPVDDSIDDVTLDPQPDDEISLDLGDDGLVIDDIIDDISLETPPAAPASDAFGEGESDASDKPVDTLDDSFLDTDFDYLGPEDGDQPTDGPATDDQDFGVDADRYRLMARQKRHYELEMELSSLTDQQQFDGCGNLATQAAEALKQAREIYNQGTDFEHQGNPSKALSTFQQVEAICSDYPGIQEDIERTEQAKELLGDWAEPDSQFNDGISDAPEEDMDQEEDLFPPEGDRLSSLKSGSRTFFEQTARKTSKVVPLAVGVAILLCVATIGVYYFISASTLDDAKEKFAECKSVLPQNRFSEAERQCQLAIDIANQVQYFNAGERDSLIEEIKIVQNSQGLTEGLAGNLLLDGKYLPKKVVKTIRAFRYFTAEGDKHFKQEAWQQAASSYKQGLDLASKNEGVDPQVLFAVSENMKMAEFNVLLRSGSELIERQKWVLAAEDLNKALAYVKNLNIENKAEMIDEISAKLAEISLATSKEEGDLSFSQGKWEEALVHYKKALNAVKKSYATDHPTIEELNQLVIKAQLYYTVNEGKEAFTNANWDAAIDNYGKAIEILESNRAVLKMALTDGNRQKLARVMLQASVIRDKQDAARFLKEKDYEEAINKLQSVIDSITGSTFSNEEEFAAVVDDTRNLIKQTETDILLTDKIIFLEDNFKDLFTTHYTIASPESLVEPRVIFEKQLGQKLIFKLECIEIGRGRPLKLVMKYAHDLDRGTWSFYSSSN
jgi:tetratricopeptide (TPR) repeat protein/ubiquitin-protein ligase